MPRVVALLSIVLLLSCDDGNPTSTSGPVTLGAVMCGKKPMEMMWLRDLVKKAQTDMALNGNIYRGYYDGQVIFIHQPMIMSCLACIIYDCSGNKLDPATLDHEKIRLNMTRANVVYQAH